MVMVRSKINRSALEGELTPEKEMAFMARIAVLMTVVSLMVVMLAMSVAPAFAASPFYTCTKEGEATVVNVPSKYAHNSPSGYERYGYVCTRQ
ncbi:MAG TPA: hypothetical protein VKA20_01490 [Rubrobacter sp.]|nr:hypothetical protein [Rubrobacter sp.]